MFYNGGFAGTGGGRKQDNFTLHQGLGGCFDNVFYGRQQIRRDSLALDIFFQHSFQPLVFLVGFKTRLTYLHVGKEVNPLGLACFPVYDLIQ
jgi:hypothetical protein